MQIKLTEKHQEALRLINEAIKFGANIWSHPKGSRGGKEEFNDVCEYCGKRIKDVECNYLSILTNGIIIPNSIDERLIWDLYNSGLLNDQPQGAFSIGITCAKKLLGEKITSYL